MDCFIWCRLGIGIPTCNRSQIKFLLFIIPLRWRCISAVVLLCTFTDGAKKPSCRSTVSSAGERPWRADSRRLWCQSELWLVSFQKRDFFFTYLGVECSQLKLANKHKKAFELSISILIVGADSKLDCFTGEPGVCHVHAARRPTSGFSFCLSRKPDLKKVRGYSGGAGF